MAKSSKGKTGKSKIDESVTDAVEVSEQDISSADTVFTDDLTGDLPEEDDILNAENEDQVDLEMEIVDDPVEPEVFEQSQEPVADPAVTAPEQQASSGGFMPLLLGGVVAGAIGYGVATFFPIGGAGDDRSTEISMQAQKIADLEAQIADIPVTDLTSVEAQIAELGTQSSAQANELAAGLADQLAGFDARLSEVEKQPNADGTLSDTALAAYQRELAELRQELEAQKEDVMSATAQAEADLAAAREEAVMAAQAATSRAALNRITAALDTGAPFADALADLEGAELPAALSSAAETGVATATQLADDFPAAARAALATARAEGVSDDAGGFGGFLRSQFDVRSTAPQEGSGPDAVLSRAEAAIKEGRVADALAEIEALPEVARAEMTDWTARATERSDVLDAIASLSETYN
mgnify:FL=1